ncbi:MAG: hypothetical protein H0V73_03590 [Chloroflexi bacterium]|nr:hypothetical protein [Chloroflexota bacterium]
MPAFEPVAAVRVVASPEALDGARWSGDGVDILRTASDEAIGIGATAVDVDDPDAIVEPEAGFLVALLDEHDVRRLAAHTEWELSTAAGKLFQGKVAGVPARILGGRPGLLVTNAAYADELERRLGWR